MARPMRPIPPGMRFASLTVLSVPNGYGVKSKALCLCDCGNEASVTIHNLLRASTTSCGCFRRNRMRTRVVKNKTHGLSRTREIRIWSGMLKRCYDPNDMTWPSYGAVGIGVCDRWRESVANFYADMGPRPSPTHQIDRIDGTKGYSPENCRWATRHEQARNRNNNRWLTNAGRTLIASDWARELGISRSSLHSRLKRMTLAEVFEAR